MTPPRASSAPVGHRKTCAILRGAVREPPPSAAQFCPAAGVRCAKTPRASSSCAQDPWPRDDVSFGPRMQGFPQLGTGIGLRPPHYADVAAGRARVDWLEVITENFMVEGGNPRRVWRAVRERYPVVLHGVSMSIGSIDPLDERYLDALAALAREIEPAWISDHL